jgi:hypothetical protein
MRPPDEYLHRWIEQHPAMSPKLTTFPSGAFMIDVNIDGEAQVLEFVPGRGFGISRKKTAMFGSEGVEHEFATFDEAEAYIHKFP